MTETEQKSNCHQLLCPRPITALRLLRQLRGFRTTLE